MITSESSLVPLTYELAFDRGTNLSKDILATNYKMVLTVDEKTDTSTLPSNEIILAYTLYIEDSKLFLIEVDGKQFDQTVSGLIGFKLIASESRVLQETGPELEGIKDEENMPVSLEDVKVDFEFDYDEFNSKESIKSTVNNIEGVTSNPAAQTVIFLASLNPMMFSFSANILNRFVYFRGLKTIIPSNLDSMFAILGSSWGVRSGKTDYEDNSPDKPKSFLDETLGIESADQNPPLKFKEMRYTDIYIKSALPIILINFSLYLIVLLIILINKSL